MRAIRFRGKDALTGEWIEGYFAIHHIARMDNHDKLLGHDETPCIFNDEPGQKSKGCYWHQVKPETVGQFTGLTDMMGRKVYEGDIVVIDGEPADRRIVVYYEEAFNLGTQKECDYLSRGEHPYLNDYAHMTALREWSDSGLVRVIGNIHDNPEMI